MTKDPYRVLGLPHEATPKQIKDAYRKLALELHPDRLTRQNAPEQDINRATAKFADVTGAYSLLTDPIRKRQFDHIYKYGGFDDCEEKSEMDAPSSGRQQSSNNNSPSDPLSPKRDARGNRVPQKGIGYTCTDHLAFLLSKGKQKSTTVAGVQIPSRLHVSRPQAGAGGFRLSFSSGKYQQTPCGSKRYTSKTTQFVAGKKFTKVETTVVHPDGRKEILIEGDDYVERRFTPPTKRSRSDTSSENVAQARDGGSPWYMEAWQGIRDKLTACYSPCVPVHVQ